MTARRDPTGTEIAIVGMSGRFPGAAGVEALWRNLREGDHALCVSGWLPPNSPAAGSAQ